MLAERAKIACYKTERKKDPLSYWARSQRLYDNEQSTTPRRLDCIGCRAQAPKWVISMKALFLFCRMPFPAHGLSVGLQKIRLQRSLRPAAPGPDTPALDPTGEVGLIGLTP